MHCWLVNFFKFFVLEVEKPDFIPNFKVNFQWLQGNIGEIPGADWSLWHPGDFE
jgi:hypothetical protein